jgi:succinate dehydrogenase / fumarate reductase membrane anchor subunit
MQYMTARKRAEGLGSAKDGTHEHVSMQISSVGLLILVPLFLVTFGTMLGRPHDEVVAYFARPIPAAIAGLTLLVGFMHFKNGVRVLIEDYVGGMARKVLIVATICLSYAAAATALFALARLAL